MATMIERIEERRARARRSAVVLYVQAAVVLALYSSLLVLVVVIGVVRFLWMIGRDGESLTDAASTGAVVAGGLALVTFMLTITVLLLWWWLRGGAVLLRRLGAHELPEVEAGRVANLVEELSIGLGIEPPTVRLIDDRVANATAFRARRRRWVLLTSGALELPRNELQALVANVLSRVVATDTDAIGRALLAVNATCRFTVVGYWLGSVCFIVVGLAAELGGTFLFTWAIMGGLFLGLSILASRLLDSRADRVADQTDAAADLATVALTNDPGSLAALMRRLAADQRDATKVPARYGRLFFKHVLTKARLGDDLIHEDPAAVAQGRTLDLRRRVTRTLSDRAAEVERIHGLVAPESSEPPGAVGEPPGEVAGPTS